MPDDAPMEGFPPLGSQQTREVVYSILNDDQRKRFEVEQQLDFAYAIPQVARFRVNCFFQRGAVSAAFRLVPQDIPSLDSLGVPQVLREFRLNGEAPAPGAEVKVDIFAPGELVKVTGTTKGRGFQGVVHRHGFGGGPATHGNTRHRKPGSISPGTDPSRVIKGKKMPGHYGDARHTQTHLRVEKIDMERNLIYIRGSIAGPRNGIVMVRKQA